MADFSEFSPKAVIPLSTKTRHSHVAKGGTYETLETQHLRDKPMSAPALTRTLGNLSRWHEQPVARRLQAWFSAKNIGFNNSLSYSNNG